MTNTARLQYPNKRQFILTIPKGLVLAKGWGQGNMIEFIIDNKGDIVIRRKNEKMGRR
jgi:bifunctional DNA-binding transcriptional regulator/antitoxin component of YhaV-PrlF toxin-antitoxin module